MEEYLRRDTKTGGKEDTHTEAERRKKDRDKDR